MKIDGHIVLICTGLHRRHYPNDSVMHANCGITAEATHWLADRSRVHGVEAVHSSREFQALPQPSRLPRSRNHPLRMAVQPRRVLGKGEFYFQGLPLKIDKGSGSPVRAIAMLG